MSTWWRRPSCVSWVLFFVDNSARRVGTSGGLTMVFQVSSNEEVISAATQFGLQGCLDVNSICDAVCPAEIQFRARSSVLGHHSRLVPGLSETSYAWVTFHFDTTMITVITQTTVRNHWPISPPLFSEVALFSSLLYSLLSSSWSRSFLLGTAQPEMEFVF